MKPCNMYTEFQCANKHCIPKSQVCDFADNCGDSSDELGCVHRSTCSDLTKGELMHLGLQCVKLKLVVHARVAEDVECIFLKLVIFRWL